MNVHPAIYNDVLDMDGIELTDTIREIHRHIVYSTGARKAAGLKITDHPAIHLYAGLCEVFGMRQAECKNMGGHTYVDTNTAPRCHHCGTAVTVYPILQNGWVQYAL